MIGPVQASGLRAHTWSVGASGGQHTLLLDNIQLGATRLISCQPATQQTDGSDGAQWSTMALDICIPILCFSGVCPKLQKGLTASFGNGAGNPEASVAVGGDEADFEPLLTCPLWLSLSVDAEVFPASRVASYEPLTDWRLMARPPLVLENHLPIGGTFLVWERQQVVYRRHNSHPGRRMLDVYGSYYRLPHLSGPELPAFTPACAAVTAMLLWHRSIAS